MLNGCLILFLSLDKHLRVINTSSGHFAVYPSLHSPTLNLLGCFHRHSFPFTFPSGKNMTPVQGLTINMCLSFSVNHIWCRIALPSSSDHCLTAVFPPDSLFLLKIPDLGRGSRKLHCITAHICSFILTPSVLSLRNVCAD